MRKVYLDNIRWAAVLLVVLYHVCYLFNGAGVMGGFPNAHSLALFDTFAAVVYPWFMVLLFVVSGMSARYALQGCSGGQLIRARAKKLLVPSTLGLFFVHWVTGYLNLKNGGALAGGQIPPFLIYPISVVAGQGPLWFAQLLFLYSWLLVLFCKLDRRDRLWTACGKANLPVLLLLALPVYGAAQVCNVPVISVYRIGIYGLCFLLGYLVFSHDEVQQRLARGWPFLLPAALLAMALYAISYDGTDFTKSALLQSPTTNLYLWIVVLAVLSCGKRFFNRETRLTRYMARAGFGVYVLHYPVLMLLCNVLCNYLALPALLNYILAFALGLPLTLLAYEGLRRIPLVRFCVLGIGKSNQGPQ